MPDHNEAAKAEKERIDRLNKSRPTPTQEENDKARLGEHPKLADDGSGPDPHAPPLDPSKKK